MKILITVDMQNDFITGALGNDECRAVVKNVVDEIKSGKYEKVIFTRDTHNADYLSTQEGQNLPVEHCIKDTEGWQLIPEIQEIVGAPDADNDRYEIFDKPTFGSVSLGEYIRDNYPNEDITVVGVCTGICVISNASLIKAFCPEAKISVIADACACVTPESHRTALDAMNLLQIRIV